MAVRLDLAPDLVIWHGDVREALKQIPDESVQCVVTSPPYFGLRDYGTAEWEGGDPDCNHRVGNQVPDNKAKGAISAGVRPGVDASHCVICGARRVDKQIGLEQSVGEYVQTMVEVFREVRRVLRKDGTLWLNLGDSYNGSGGAGGDYNEGGLKEGQPRYPGRRLAGLKPKDLIGVPWAVAFALRDDGWYLRADIIWHKPNPMPESVEDRPTKAHEYIFLLSKSASYYYDADAIREPAHSLKSGNTRRVLAEERGRPAGAGSERGVSFPWENTGQGRNKRSVWTVPTRPFPEAHFAVYPPDLVEPCILAGTSPMACPHCGAPWERVVEKVGTNKANEEGIAEMVAKGVPRQKANLYVTRERGHTVTLDWRPTCSCEGNDGSGKCWILDPFLGSGTTAAVALQHGRAAIGIELNPQYIEIAKRRLCRTQTTLLGML